MPITFSLATRGVRDRAVSGEPAAPVRPARRRRSRTGALRRLRRAFAVRPGAASLDPVMALRIVHRPEVSDLAHAWRVLDLEAGLALAAWSRAPRHQRRRAHRAYRDALAREAWVAALLAQHTRDAAAAG